MAAARVFTSNDEFFVTYKEKEANNTKLVKQQIHNSFPSNDFSSLHDKRVRFENDDHPSSIFGIPYDGISFIIMNSESYKCLQEPHHVRELPNTNRLSKLLCTQLPEKPLFLQTDPVNADSYIPFVCLKEEMIWMECIRSGTPYKKINEMFSATEKSVKSLRKELQ